MPQVRKIKKVSSKTVKTGQPTISRLGKQLEVMNKKCCGRLMGAEVIEQQISDLVRGKLDNNYCQNWDRCPTNDWGKCTPDPQKWIQKIRVARLDKVLTASEKRVVTTLLGKRKR